MEFHFGVILEGDAGVLHEGEEPLGCWCNLEYPDDATNLAPHERQETTLLAVTRAPLPITSATGRSTKTRATASHDNIGM